MLIFPAIDLRDGQVVRLTEGDYDQMTVYGTDPLAAAASFREAGAEWLHVVDLDAAKDGGQKNFANARTVRNILDQVIMNQNLRTEDSDDDRTILLSDVEDYIMDENIDLQKKPSGTIGFI